MRRKVVLLAAALAGVLSVSLAMAASEAVEDAVNAGKTMPLPDYEALKDAPDVTGFVADNTGSTAEIEALWQNGQGALYAPGRSEADACWSKNDPRCLAVQMVDKASTNRPVLDPDLTGDLTAGRDEILDNAEDLVDLGGTGSSTGNCTEHTTTITKPEETLTCDVRTHETPGASVEETCRHAFEEILSETSVWACKTTYAETTQNTCSIPVVVRQTTNTTLACFEGKKDAEALSCPVTVTPAQTEKHYAACVKPLMKSVVRTCTRRLVVTTDASCRPGDEQSAANTDYANLGEDDVAGADTLEVTSICAQEGVRLRLCTNAQAGAKPALSVEVTSDVFETVLNIAGGIARFEGSWSCSKADCIAFVTMTVYRAAGTSHIKQGEVSVRLPFTRFVKTAETEHWSETCTGL